MIHTPKTAIYRILYSLIFFLLCTQAFCTHLATGQISYTATRISPDSVQVDLQLILLRDEGGLGLGTSTTVNYHSFCNNLSFNFSIDLDSIVSIYPQGRRCIDSTSNLIRAQQAGYYTTTVFFVDQTCIDGLFYWSDCCRPTSIDNLANAASKGMYSSASLYLADSTQENKSPVFDKTNLWAESCVGYMMRSGNLLHDPDGDSLYVQLGESLELVNFSNPPSTDTLLFTGNYTLSDPVTSANGIFLNPSTGELTYEAVQPEVTMVSYRVKEYRYLPADSSWALVSEIIYDQMFEVYANCAKTIDSISYKEKKDLPQLAYKPYVEANCNDSVFVVNFNNFFDLRTLSHDGSEFRIYSNKYALSVPITRVRPLNTSSFFSNAVEIQTTHALDFNDTLVVYTKNGSDGNTLISECGAFLQPNDTLYLLVSDCSGVGIPEESMENAQLTLYPNPTANSLWLESRHPNARFEEVKVFDASGRLMQLPFTAKSESRLTLDVESLSEGIYFIHIQLSSGAFVLKKFVKE